MTLESRTLHKKITRVKSEKNHPKWAQVIEDESPLTDAYWLDIAKGMLKDTKIEKNTKKI